VYRQPTSVYKLGGEVRKSRFEKNDGFPDFPAKIRSKLAPNLHPA